MKEDICGELITLQFKTTSGARFIGPDSLPVESYTEAANIFVDCADGEKYLQIDDTGDYISYSGSRRKTVKLSGKGPSDDVRTSDNQILTDKIQTHREILISKSRVLLQNTSISQK